MRGRAVPKFQLSFGLTCPCGNCNPSNFYIYPMEGIRGDNTFGHIPNQYRLACCACHEEFTVKVEVRSLRDEIHEANKEKESKKADKKRGTRTKNKRREKKGDESESGDF